LPKIKRFVSPKIFWPLPNFWAGYATDVTCKMLESVECILWQQTYRQLLPDTDNVWDGCCRETRRLTPVVQLNISKKLFNAPNTLF